jgi:hypothetical protein
MRRGLHRKGGKRLRRKGLTVTGWNDWYGSGFIPLMPKPFILMDTLIKST